MAPHKPAPPSSSIDLATIVIPETEISDIAAKRYSEFLIASNERQIPDVRDGLKPVQRRILLTFKDLNMKASSSHRKSAKVVGDTMANMHPHGDTGIYDAAVVMAQDWHFRYPLIDGSGNFGSIDGSGAGASRYTEMRPAPMGDEMVRDLHDRAAGVVPWTRNYLDDRDEPWCLPSRFPNLLVNGILLGIGTGHSASWLPHNLGEVIDAVIAVIDDPTIAARDLIRWMKGPDFPTGCTIIGTEGYLEALETGRGRVVARAKMAVEEDGRDQAIVITEIPWKEDKTSIIEQIMTAGRPDKSGSAARIPGILDCEDQSGRDWRTETRIVVSLRRDANPKLVGALLYKHTALETAYSYHQNAYQNVYPVLFNTREVIDAYIAFQMEVLTRRTQYRRQIALDILEVQNAYLFAYRYENKLVPLARASKNKAELETKIPSIVREAITERQCRIIAEMPLYRFSQIDTEAVKGKIADLTVEIAEYDRLLATTTAMAELLKVELREIKAKYGDPRRTAIAGAKVEDLKSIDEMTPDEACYLVLASSGLVARHSATIFRAAKRGQTGVATAKSDDDPILQVIGARTKDRVWLLTNQGTVFAVRANELEEVSRGARGTNVRRFLSLSEGEQVAYLIVPPARDTEGDLYIVTTGGKILRSNLADYGNINAGGLKAIKLRSGDAVASAFIAAPGEVILVTSDGFSARFDVMAAGVPVQGRGSQGVDAIKVNPGAQVVSADAIVPGDKRDLATVLSNGRGKKTSLSEYPVKGRSIRGITAIGMPAAPKSVRVAFAGVLAEADQAIITTTGGRAIVLPAKEIKRQGRATAGVITVGLSSAKGSSEEVANGAVVLGG